MRVSYFTKTDKYAEGIMYRKRNQLMEICICLADAVMVLVSLVIAGLLRYRVSYSDGCRRDGSSDQRVIGIACGSILFSESIRWIFSKRTL